MASNFTQFLVKLSNDPKLLRKYLKTPEAVMIAEGLTHAEIALLLSGDGNLIRSAFVNDPDHKAALGVSPDQEIQIQAVTMLIP